MNTAYTIEVKNLSYRRDDKTLLSGIEWKVRKGEHWALLGLNGSGKTTLLNMITGYLWPTTGVISVLGETYGSVDLREMRKSIGWVSSSLQEKLYASDKAQVVVLSGKYATIGLYDKPDEKDYEQASELMKRLGCSHLWDRTYQTCSQGEKQKLLIARALMANPRLLILDEPATDSISLHGSSYCRALRAWRSGLMPLPCSMSRIIRRKFCPSSPTSSCCAAVRCSQLEKPGSCLPTIRYPTSTRCRWRCASETAGLGLP